MPSAAAGVIRRGQGTPGQGGQPHGLMKRPKHDLKNYSFKYARRVIDNMFQIVEDRSAPAGDRISAGREILDRALGKAHAHATITQDVSGTFMDALRIMAERDAKPLITNDVVDITPETGEST